MKKRAIAVVLVITTFVATGCSSTETESSEQSNFSTTLTPDAALDEIINSFKALSSAGDSKESLMTGFTSMIDALNPVAASLSAGMPGVPSDVSLEVAVAVGTFAATSQLVVDCLEDALVASDCETFVSAATTQSQVLGAGISQLLPYSTMTREEFMEKLRGS